MKYFPAPSPMIGPAIPWKSSSGNGDLSLCFFSLPQPLSYFDPLGIGLRREVIAGFHWLNSFWAWKVVREISLRTQCTLWVFPAGPLSLSYYVGYSLGFFAGSQTLGTPSASFSWGLSILTSISLRAHNNLMSLFVEWDTCSSWESCISWKYKLIPKYQPLSALNK